MSVFNVATTLLAIREYQNRPVPKETIQRIVESAHLTGSSMNLQPWHFIVVEERATLRELGNRVKTGPYIADAAFAVVVVIEHTRFAVSDGSRAIQTMMLTAWDEGVGSNWAGFMGPDEVKPLLDIPDDMDVLAVVPFGYPAREQVHGKKQRKDFADVVNAERFGAPFA